MIASYGKPLWCNKWMLTQKKGKLRWLIPSGQLVPRLWDFFCGVWWAQVCYDTFFVQGIHSRLWRKYLSRGNVASEQIFPIFSLKKVDGRRKSNSRIQAEITSTSSQSEPEAVLWLMATWGGVAERRVKRETFLVCIQPGPLWTHWYIPSTALTISWHKCSLATVLAHAWTCFNTMSFAIQSTGWVTDF